MKRRQSELARIVRKRLDTLAIDMPPEIAAVLHAEAKAMAAVVDEFQRQQKGKHMKRTDTEINNEIVALKNALALKDRWNDATREQIKGSIEVLEKRMTPKQVEDGYYCDESAEEYKEGDNLLWAELDRVARWLAGEDEDAPSKDLL